MSLRPYLLGAVAAALAGLVVWDYWPAGPEAPQASPQAAATPAATAVPTLNPLSRKTDADFAPLFDHPLFDTSRTKQVVEAPPPETAPEPAVADQPAPDLPRGPVQPVLMGTVTSPWPGGAYLGDDAGGPVVFLRPGQASQGLHLEEVRSDSAIFMGPGGEVTLPLQKRETPDAGAPPSDAPQTDAPQTDAPQNDAPQPDLSQPDGSATMPAN